MFFFMNQRRLLLAGGAAGAVFKSFADTCDWSPSPASCMKITEVAGFIPREFWGLSATQTFDTRDQFKKAAPNSKDLRALELSYILINWETKTKKPEISSGYHTTLLPTKILQLLLLWSPSWNPKIWIDWSEATVIATKIQPHSIHMPSFHVELFACQKIQFPGKISHLFALGVMTLEDSKLWEAPMKMEDSLVLWTKWRNGHMNPL